MDEATLSNLKLTAVYARVSSSNQENEGTIETQLLAIRDFAQKSGLLIVKEYLDEGWSGDSLERPALDQLRVDTGKRIWQTVLIYDPDRLARRYSYQELICDELREKGIEITFVTTPSPKDGIEKILFGVQGLFAEYERAKIAERFRLGKVRKAKEGHILSTEAPFGYTFIPKKGIKGDVNFQHGYYEINAREAEIVKNIFHWVGVEQFTLRAVVRRLQSLEIPPRKSKRGVWSTSTLSSMLRNKTYVGEAHYGASVSIIPKKPLKSTGYKKIKKSSRRMRPESEWIKIPTPRLIDDHLFSRVQEQLRNNFERAQRNTKNEYLLSGKLVCMCGRKRTGEGIQNGKHLYYRCTDRVYSFPLPSNCTAKGINARKADEAVWQRLFQLISSRDFLVKRAEKWTNRKRERLGEFINDTDSIKDEIKKLKQQEDRYTSAFGTGLISLENFKKFVSPVRDKISALTITVHETKPEKHQNQGIDLPGENEILKFVEFVKLNFNNLLFYQKKQIVNNFIHSIVEKDKTLLVRGAIPLNLHSNYVLLCTNDRHCVDTIPSSPYPSVNGQEKSIPFEFVINL